MKKTWLLFTLLLAIAILITLISSFYSVSEGEHIDPSSVSAVVISKERYVSLRAHFYIHPFPNSTMTLSFPNGSQKTVTTSYNFEVFLPKTALPIEIFPPGPEVAYISDEHPIDAQIIANITNDTIRDFNGTYFRVSVYWFAIQGNGSVSFSAYGVAI